MKRLLFFLLCNLTVITCFSQHLTYNDFTKLSKINSISAINNYMSTRGYTYRGIRTEKTRTRMFWTNNCWITDFNGLEFNFEWNTGELRSVMTLCIDDSTMYYLYELPSKSAYNTFKVAIKNNGYRYIRDGVSANGYIYQIFIRQRKGFRDEVDLYDKGNGAYFCNLFFNIKKRSP